MLIPLRSIRTSQAGRWKSLKETNMAKNIEIKASLNDLKSCLDKASSLSGDDPEVIKQEDYFFHCDNGRLKLRVLSNQKGVLIFYDRKNKTGPKPSEYCISETDEPNKLLKVLEKAHGIFGIVRKTRKLFLIGRTRVHIDNVENIGDFMEFEVVLSENEDAKIGVSEVQYLMNQFGIKKENLIDCAYVDLINSGKPPALPERLPEFDNSWNIRKPPTVNCSKFKKGGFR